MKKIHRKWAGIVDEPADKNAGFNMDLTLRNMPSGNPLDLKA